MEIHIASLLLGILIVSIIAIISFVFGVKIIRGREKLTHNNKMNELRLKYSILEERYADFKNSQNELEEESRIALKKNEKLHEDNLKLNAELLVAKDKLAFQKNEIERIQQEFTQGFELLSNRILRNNSIEFADFNKAKMLEILTPLQDKILSFESQINRIHKEDIEARSGLSVELKRLVSLNQQLSEDAVNLTNSLRQDNKQQGNWGELVLEKILEKSGLLKGQEYRVQETFKNEEGQSLRPDVVILLPENKHIVIDSKVSLTAYDRFVNTDDEKLRLTYVKQHLLSVKSHINALGAKNYDTLTGINSPDFVLLFIPIESAFSLAVREDAEIFQYAWEMNIVIVSPSTLLATLRTVSSIWKHEKQTQNAFQIANEAGKMYDKFVNFIHEYEKVGLMIGRLQESYDNSHKKLISGKGNVISKIEGLRKMGISNKKEIPQNFSKDLK